MSFDSSLNITLDSNHDAVFNVSGNERLRIDSLGNIGIGTMSPATRLSLGANSDSIPFVVGSYEATYPPLLNIRDDTYDDAASIAHFSRGDSVFQLYGNGLYHQRGTGDIAAFYTTSGHVYVGNSSRSSYIRFNTDNNILLETTGNVGIGTTNPNRKFVIYQATYPTMQILNDAAGGTGSNNGFEIFQGGNSTVLANRENGNMTFKTNDTDRLKITSEGNVGIGTTGPRGLLDILDAHGFGTSGSEGLYYRRDGFYYGWRWYSRHNRSWDFMHQSDNDIFYVYFQNSTSQGGYFDPNQNVGMFDFTGQHRGFVENIPSTESEDYKGLIVSANKNTYYDIDYSIKTGKDAIKINESLPYVSLCKKEKDKSVYGVISDGEEGETRNDSGGTFVSVSEKQYGDNRIFINSLGEGAIWVSNKNGNLESGDYITSSAIPGYGQKQDSESLKNYTVAKITMDCDFQPEYIYKKKVTTRNVDITGPDASGNYYDILNNERLYTIDLSNEIIDNKNKKYMLTFDSANNLIGATQNLLDEKGQVQWEDTSEQEYAYEIRHVDPSGIVITKEQHDSTISNGGSAYIAAFVGCTYHCG